MGKLLYEFKRRFLASEESRVGEGTPVSFGPPRLKTLRRMTSTKYKILNISTFLVRS
jgi:hypothetical protein